MRGASAHASGARMARNLLLGSLAAIVFARAPYAATSMDLGRDMFTAWRILHGQEFPLRGPILSGAIHLGPVWYYLLAVLMALAAGTWFGTIALIGALAALQVPLAYLAGKAACNRTAGVLWAAGLVIPSWSTFESMLPLHTQLTATMSLAFLLCAIRHWKRPRRRYLIGAALFFMLALHAHPSSAAFVWVGLAMVAWAFARAACDVRTLAIAAIALLAPMLPLLYWNATHGFADLRGGDAYVMQMRAAASLTRAWPLFQAVAIGGTRYWLDTMLNWPPALARGVIVLIAVAGVAALHGIARALLQPRTRAIAVVSSCVVSAVLLSTLVLRDITPYYMTTPLRVVLAGTTGIGLALLGAARVAIGIRGGFLAIAIATGVAATAGAARWQTRGAWPFAWWPIADVVHAPGSPLPLLLMPAYAIDSSGRFLCSQPAPSVHGAYAGQVLFNYAMEMRLACKRSDVQLGGSDAARQHWLGLSRAMFARIDVKPALRLGPLGVIAARPLRLDDSPALTVPETPVYPAYTPPASAPREVRVAFSLGADERLALANIGTLISPDVEVEVTLDGRRIEPRASDLATQVFACEGCLPDHVANGVLVIRAVDLAAVDAVVF